MFVLTILFIYLTSSALVEGQKLFESVFKSVEIYDPVTGNYSKAVDLDKSKGGDRGLILPFGGAPCVCEQNYCKCCTGIRINPLKIDKIVCIHLNFYQEVMGVQVQLTVGNFTGLNVNVSALPLPPICAPIISPSLPIPLMFCVIIYDVILPVKTVPGQEFQDVCGGEILAYALSTKFALMR